MSDLDDFFRKASTWARTAGNVAKAYTQHSELVGMLNADLDTGKALIARLVQALPAAELADFEARFLKYSSFTIHDPKHKRRAMELYAHLKVLQSKRGGAFVDLN